MLKSICTLRRPLKEFSRQCFAALEHVNPEFFSPNDRIILLLDSNRLTFDDHLVRSFLSNGSIDHLQRESLREKMTGNQEIVRQKLLFEFSIVTIRRFLWPGEQILIAANLPERLLISERVNRRD